MVSHLQEQKNTLKSLIKEYNTPLLSIINNFGKNFGNFGNISTNRMIKRLRESQAISLKTKIKSLRRVLELKKSCYFNIAKFL